MPRPTYLRHVEEAHDPKKDKGENDTDAINNCLCRIGTDRRNLLLPRHRARAQSRWDDRLLPGKMSGLQNAHMFRAISKRVVPLQQKPCAVFVVLGSIPRRQHDS